MSHLRYRPDIDGLRAIAVMPVVLYHAGVRGFSGGYVGVDVFFVISGYLITSIIISDMKSDRFSIAQFYRRRAVRILPALCVMITITAVLFSIYLLPMEVEALSRSISGSALFVSNIVFYTEADYFLEGSFSRPLLHTWSLSVEEQWYILWPILLTIFFKLSQKGLLAITISLIIASLASSIYLLENDQSAAFYLLPSRAWELLFGSFLCFVPHAQKGKASELQAALGLTLIALSVKFYTSETSFPGFAAIAPCLGAALLIHAGGASRYVGGILASAPFRMVGIISYSVYLWHWPVIAFVETGFLLDRTPWVAVCVVAVSLGLGAISWYYVERPFRKPRPQWLTRAVLGAAFASIVFLLVLAALIPAIGRIISPLTPTQTELAAFIAFDGDATFRKGTCFKVGPRSNFDEGACLAPASSRPTILVVGDSHAAHLWPGLRDHLGPHDIRQATVTSCKAVLPPRNSHGYCQEVINAALRDWLSENKPASLILASRWRLSDIDALTATLRDPLVRNSNPILIGPVPEYGASLTRLLVAGDRRGDPSLADRALRQEQFDLDAKMSDLAKHEGVPYFSIIDELCDGNRCKKMLGSRTPVQFDYGHLTPAGSYLVTDALINQLQLQRNPAP